MFWNKNKDMSRFVENVLLYLLKLFPFSYRNGFTTEKYVFFVFFFYTESIVKLFLFYRSASKSSP